jgi:hypothetical protein
LYGKIFSMIYDGTLAGNWKALVTFQQMIVLCDDCGTLDMTPIAISGRTGIPLDIIEEGIAYLEQDDPYSRTPAENGKRIVRLDDHRPWGWKIVNHAVYKKMACYEDKKKSDRERIAKKRKENNDVACCSDVSQNVAGVAHTDTDTDKKKKNNIKKRKKRIPTDFYLSDVLLKYATDKGMNKKLASDEFEGFTLYHRKKGTEFVDWSAAWQTWVRNHFKFKQESQPLNTLPEIPENPYG